MIGSFEIFEEQSKEIEESPTEAEQRHGNAFETRHTLAKWIKNISIKTLSKYDDKHPEGASLSDISYGNIAFYAEKQEARKGDNAYIKYQFDTNYLLKYPYIDPIAREGNWDEASSPLKGEHSSLYLRRSKLMDIYLKEKPSSPKQSVSVKIDFQDGTSLEARGDLDFDKIISKS